MDELTLIDSFLDDREFRSRIASLMQERGYEIAEIEDARLADGRSDNDNDLLVRHEGKTYTVQTFLNRIITEREIHEAVLDIDVENADGGILVTNTETGEELKQKALA